jgi:hypothetical protein
LESRQDKTRLVAPFRTATKYTMPRRIRM